MGVTEAVFDFEGLISAWVIKIAQIRNAKKAWEMAHDAVNALRRLHRQFPTLNELRAPVLFAHITTPGTTPVPVRAGNLLAAPPSEPSTEISDDDEDLDDSALEHATPVPPPVARPIPTSHTENSLSSSGLLVDSGDLPPRPSVSPDLPRVIPKPVPNTEQGDSPPAPQHAMAPESPGPGVLAMVSGPGNAARSGENSDRVLPGAVPAKPGAVPSRSVTPEVVPSQPVSRAASVSTVDQDIAPEGTVNRNMLTSASIPDSDGPTKLAPLLAEAEGVTSTRMAMEHLQLHPPSVPHVSPVDDINDSVRSCLLRTSALTSSRRRPTGLPTKHGPMW